MIMLSKISTVTIQEWKWKQVYVNWIAFKKSIKKNDINNKITT